MNLFDKGERRIAEAISKLTHVNPFLPERIEHERAVLEREPDAAFLFAYGYQTRRAFHFVFRHL